MKIFTLIIASLLLAFPSSSQSYVLGFNGTSQSVNLGSQVINDIRTIEFWFKPQSNIVANSTTKDQSLIMRDDAQINEFGLHIRGVSWPLSARGYLYFYIRDNGVLHEIKSNTNTWDATTWYHVAAVIDPTNGMKLYVNGALQTNTDPTLTHGIISSSENTKLGTWGDANIRYFQGRMDEVKLWTRYLTQEEINQNKCICMNPNYQDGLVSYWKFNEGSGTTANNSAIISAPANVNASWINENPMTAENTNCDKKNEFKIGIMAAGSLGITQNWGYAPTYATNNGQNTSMLNILKKDGINIVHNYGNEMDANFYTGWLNLIQKNNLTFFGNFKDFYRPTNTNSPSGTYSTPQGFNVYNGTANLCSPGGWNLRPNYDNIIQNILPNYKDVIWGVQTNEEAAYCHAALYNAGCDGFPRDGENGDYCGFKNDSYLSTEKPVANINSARTYFKNAFSNNNLDVKLVSMEAPHGQRLNYVPSSSNTSTAGGLSSIAPKDFVTNLTSGDSKDIFIEGSYTNLPWNASNPSAYLVQSTSPWYSQQFNNPSAYHYLNKFQNINFADDYAYQVHSVLPLATYYGSNNFVSSRPLPSLLTNNADYLWFLAYNSIIHGAKGVWFYDALDKSSYSPQESQKWDNLGSSNFTESDFPNFYNQYTRHIIRELAYLKNNGFLTNDDSNVLMTRTNETLASDQLPCTISINSSIPDPDFTINDRTVFFNAHQYNANYTPRYTIRTNGEDVVLIITNQMPIGINVNLDFGCINNDIIKNSTGLDMLFSSENFISSGGNQYKGIRDGSINIQANTVANHLEMSFNGGKTITLNMGPLDAMVFKFKKATTPIFAGTNNGWDKVWTNHGDGKIENDWIIRSADKFYTGDFDGDGKKNDLFCVGLGENKWMTQLHFDGTHWQRTWSNFGQAHLLLQFRGSLIVGDFDGNGKDDLLGNLEDGNPSGSDLSDGPTGLFMFNGSNWNEVWHDGGPGSGHPIRPYKDLIIAGNFDGYGQDCIVGFDNPNGWITMFCYDNGNFHSGWSNYGSTACALQAFRMPQNSQMVTGNFSNDNNPKDEILGFWTGHADVIRFENGQFVTKLQSDPFGSSNPTSWWALPLNPTVKVMTGNIDASDPADEVILIDNAGYFATFSLQPNFADWSILWWGTNTNPYLDDLYIPQGGNWPYNYFSTFDYSSVGGNDPKGLLVIRKTCIGLANIYAGNTYNKRMAAHSDNETIDDSKNEMNQDLIIHPNPSKGLLNLKLNNAYETTYTIEVYDAVGKQIHKETKTNNSVGQFSTEINLNYLNLKTGLYLINIISAKEVLSNKIVIEE